MKTKGGRPFALGVAAIVALTGPCVAYAPAHEIRLRTVDGQPTAGAYLGYHHQSSIFNFVDSLNRSFPGSLLQTDANGHVTIPSRLGWTAPPDSRPVVRVVFVYAPHLHNAPPNGLLASIEDVVIVGENVASATLHDLTGSPERWEQSPSAALLVRPIRPSDCGSGALACPARVFERRVPPPYQRPVSPRPRPRSGPGPTNS